MTTGENPAYPQQDQGCYQIGGTHGSLAIPQLEWWSNPDKRSWWEPLRRERIPSCRKTRCGRRSGISAG